MKIEPALGLGMLINPTDWFQNEEIKLKAVRAGPGGFYRAAEDRSLSMHPHSARSLWSSTLPGGFPTGLAQDHLHRSRAGNQLSGAALRLARQPRQITDADAAAPTHFELTRQELAAFVLGTRSPSETDPLSGLDRSHLMPHGAVESVMAGMKAVGDFEH